MSRGREANNRRSSSEKKPSGDVHENRRSSLPDKLDSDANQRCVRRSSPRADPPSESRFDTRSRAKSVSGRSSCHRSSSRQSRIPANDNVSSSRSVAPRSSTISHRHSTDVSGSGSLRQLSYCRRSSAPDVPLQVENVYSRQSSVDRSKSSASTFKQVNKKYQNAPSLSTASTTSSEQDHRPRGRSLSKQKRDQKPQDLQTFFSRNRSKSKSRYGSSIPSLSGVKSRLSRGRSKSRSRNKGEDDPIISAGRSFTSSLTRRRSLSRGASTVLHTTSEMDGNQDAEPNAHRYEVPFHPSSGRCLAHPEITLAIKNEGLKGGWKIVCDGCPKCGGN